MVFGLEKFYGNYTGPYRSNGEWRSSVKFGEVDPTSELDALSRWHDTAYAVYQDYAHRTAADAIYNKQAQLLAGAFPQIARGLVLYGNATGRSASNLASKAKFGIAGLIYGGAQNAYNLHDYMLNEKKYKNDIYDLYAQDPKSQDKGIICNQCLPEQEAFGPIRDGLGLDYGEVDKYFLLRSTALKNQIPLLTDQLDPAVYDPVGSTDGLMSFLKRKRRRKRNRVYVYT